MTYRRRTVGIVGAGQLARMMIQAAIPLDIRVVLLAANPNDGAAQVCPDVIVGDPDDPTALRALGERCDVITFDHELVDPAHLGELEQAGHLVWPSSASMAVAQDKRRQRNELRALGIAMPESIEPQDLAAIEAFGERVGWPIVIKAARGGYDGRGVWVVADVDAGSRVWSETVSSGVHLIAEEHLRIEREFAMLICRRPHGEIVLYPPIETVQRAGVCHHMQVPARLTAAQATNAEALARRIAEHIGIVGILAIECFLVDGQVLFNELAPRPHNSGHWTIEGAVTSQFEQHLRAILDLPLGASTATAPAIATTNVFGRGDESDPRKLLAAGLTVPRAHVHLYGKDPRKGRKIGHVTALGEDLETTRSWSEQAANALGGSCDG